MNSVHVSFITKDGGGSYFSTAKSVDGHLEGTTHSPLTRPVLRVDSEKGTGLMGSGGRLQA
ncbi:MAG: hypothetical protein ACI8T1_000151 [Verrucomicrobiales bacterium]|jgi:hypothetical protein